MAEGRSPRRTLPLIVAVTATGVLTFAVITPALPDLARELGVSRGAIGMVQGAVALPGVVLAVLIGYAADRFGRRSVIAVSLVVFGVAGLSGFFVRSFWPLVGLRAIQGLGTSGLLSLGVVIIGDLFEGSERRWALGVNAAGITVTAMVAPVVGGTLAQGGAFRPFLLFGLAFPLLALTWMLPGRPGGAPPRRPLAHLRDTFTDLRGSGRYADFLGLLPFSLAVMVIMVGFGFTTTPLFLEEIFAVEASGRGLMQSVLAIGSTVTSLAASPLARRLRGPTIVTASLATIVVGFVGLAAAPTLLVVGGFLFVLGLGIGAIFPVVQDLAASTGSDAYRGARVGTWVSSIRLGQGVGPIIASALVVGIGERGSYWLAAGAVTLIVAAWQPLRRVATGWVGTPTPGSPPIG